MTTYDIITISLTGECETLVSTDNFLEAHELVEVVKNEIGSSKIYIVKRCSSDR